MKRNTHNPTRRGIAMLLVIISLMMATIMATAYLASRDNSAAIGQNIASASAARWSATTGLQLGLVVFETQTDWRTTQINGKLLDDHLMDGALIDLDIIDLATGQPPTGKTRYLRLTSTAIIDDVQQVATAMAYVPLEYDTAVNVDLTEFAIFAADDLRLSGDAVVTRWSTAPLADLGLRIAVGTQAVDPSSIDLLGNAATMIDTTVYHRSDASGALINDTGGSYLDQVALSGTIPLPEAPDPGVTVPEDPSPNEPVNTFGETYVYATDERWDQVTHENSHITLQGVITLVTDNDQRLLAGSTLTIDGNVTLVVFGDLIMDNSAIELTSGSTLDMYVRGAVELSDSYIGDERADNTRDNTGSAAYMDPQQVRVYGLPPYENKWSLTNNSVVKGSIYAPGYDMEIRDESALYGRVAATQLHITDQGALFYDHSMDSRIGYTNTESKLFNNDGTLITDFSSLTSLNDSDLKSLADATGMDVRAKGKTILSATSLDGAETPPDDVTPRPVPVQYEIMSFGTDVREWEQQTETVLSTEPVKLTEPVVK